MLKGVTGPGVQALGIGIVIILGTLFEALLRRDVLLVITSNLAPRELYRDAIIFERHRHRYEVNNLFREQLVDAGLVVSGTFDGGRLVEIVELPGHPWFVASQFHPEFKSRPTRPAPLFRGFVVAALERARTRQTHPVAA